MLRVRDIRLGASLGFLALAAACATTPATELTGGRSAPAAWTPPGADAGTTTITVLTRLAPAAPDPPAATRGTARLLPLPVPPPRLAVYEDSSPRTGAANPPPRLTSAIRPPLPSAPAGRVATGQLRGSASLLAGPSLPPASAPAAAPLRLRPAESGPASAVTAAPQVAATSPPASLALVPAPTVAPSPAPSPALAATTNTAMADPPGPDVGPASERTYARVGDRLELTLPGEGWIYLGDLRGQASGLSYGDRTIGDGATSFVFRAQRLGEFLLEFQLQDHRTGGERRQHLNVSIVAPSELERLIASDGAAAESAARDSEVERAVERGDGLYDDGLSDLALEAYERAFASGAGAADDPHLNDRLATLYSRREEWRRAEEHWRRNLAASDATLADAGSAAAAAAAAHATAAATPPTAAAPQPDYEVDARVGLARSAIARGDARAVAAMSSELLELPPTAGAGEVARDAVGLLQDAELWEPALLILRDYLRGGGRRLDAEMLFRLASVLESAWGGRDLREARAQYLRVAEAFPASRFARPALERVRYLDRHYFVVQ